MPERTFTASIEQEHKQIKEKRIMAKPIKETPVLYDEDAYRFEMAARKVVPLSEEERAERLEAYERLKNLS